MMAEMLRHFFAAVTGFCLVGSTLASACSSGDCEAPEGTEFYCERFGDYCDCGLKSAGGGGGERVDTCDGSLFVNGNCCFHPNTLSCRCDGEPVCTDNGTVVLSCSDAFADLGC
jgi:hypothetical protein